MKYISFCIALTFFWGSASAQLPTGGLVAYYPFDNDATDLSGSNSNGQIMGGIIPTEDRFGNSCGAMHFNGVDGYIRVLNSTSIESPVNSITITAWFKTDKSKNIDLVLLSKSGLNSKSGYSTQYRFLLSHSFGNSYSSISMSQDINFTDNNYNAHSIEPDQWYFLTLVYEESWANIFLNGKLISQSIVKRPFVTNGFDLEIGRDVIGGNKYFHGALDDLGIYNRGLSPFEVSSLFNTQTDKKKAQGVTMVLPERINKNTDPGKCSTVVNYADPVVSIGCGKAELKRIAGLSSGSAFNVGRNSIVYQAISSTSQTISDSFEIIISDKENPVFQTASDITVNTPLVANQTKVDYPIPKAVDNCPNLKLELVSGPPSGSEFPVGITKIMYKATDASGNSSECSFNVNVALIEAVPRILHCPKDIIAYTKADAENEIIKYEAPYVETNGSKTGMKKMKGFSSGSLFRIGKTEIVYETEDTGSNYLICRFNILVKDTIRPIISCSQNIKKVCEPGEKSIRVDYPLPKATDGGNPISVKIISGLMSGSVFYAGITTIRFESVDESGNKSECSFKVVVEENSKKPDIKKEQIVKDVEPIKTVVPVKVNKEVASLPEPKDDREEKIKQAEKIFMATEVEKKEAVQQLEKPVVVLPIEEKEPIVKEGEKPLTVTDKVIHQEESMVTEKPKEKDTAPQKSIKPTVPTILKCPENVIQKSDAGKCGAVVNYSAPDVKGGQDVRVTQTKGVNTNNFFKTGTTINTFSVLNAGGENSECSFRVTIKDQEPPAFNCPDDTVILLPSNRRGVIYYFDEPLVKDNCGVDSLIKEAGPKNGCFLEIGVHPFIYKAIDASGNYEMCTHSVIIKSAPPVANIEPPKRLDEQLSIGSDSIHYEYKAQVKDCLLTVFIYDDGEEDGDIVSVIFNGQVIVNKEMIRVQENGMIKRNLVLDGGNENYLVSKAWNTGKYGLNTLKIDVYEGNVENERKELKYKKPVMSKVLHSKPGNAGGIILKCSE